LIVQFLEKHLETDLVADGCDYGVLLPDTVSEGMAVLFFLHGGNGDRSFLKSMSAVIGDAIDAGDIEPLIVVTPSARMSYYMDAIDGTERWESLLLGPLRDEVLSAYIADPNRQLISGISMGGVGCLRLAFRHPDEFVATASLEPGIDPFLTLGDMPDWYKTTVDGRFGTRFGTPINEEYWRAHNPANIAEANPDRLRDSGLAIYLEVGTDDGLFNHHNTEFLHRVLFDHGIRHEYRNVLGANHIGKSMPGRVRDALRFLGRTLDPPPPDVAADAFSKATLKGYADKGVTPPS
jgi:S-formylglutathione hydrolase